MKVKAGGKDVKIDASFAQEIYDRSGENVFLCYQCKKCASGCPSREFMKTSPTELMRQVQLGMVDEAMKDSTIWYCLSCQTCSTRCPQDIDIAKVVDTIKLIVEEKGIKVDTKNERLFNRIWMTLLRFGGRIYEVGLTGMLNVFTGKPTKDLPLGMKMIKKGKLKMLPSIKRSGEMRKMFARARRIRK